MFRRNLINVFVILFIGGSSVLSLDVDNNDNDDSDNNWTGLWFPSKPEITTEPTNFKKPTESNSIDRETIHHKPIKSKLNDRKSRIHESWDGLWFPAAPGEDVPDEFQVNNNQSVQITDENSNSSCDDGLTNVSVDYDSSNILHHSRHMCIDERKLYAPSYDYAPRLLEHTIPPEYSALHKCMDEPIEYEDPIPTFGSHRQLWPVYGEYIHVPPQRWIHTLEHGGIVLLYHPCANLIQLDLIKSLIKKCLYRHVITSYNLLEPERPFALVAWGRSLEISVVDSAVVVGFIRLYALQGPEKIFSDGQYNQTLIERAQIISSADDDILCQGL